MRKIADPILRFVNLMNGLKNKKTTLLMIIALDIFMAVGSLAVDWPWLAMVKPALLPFAPICSLYPLSLTIWFTLYYFRKKIPAWFTTFIFVAIVSYGFMAWIYYPAYMAWDGIQFRLYGNIAWVTTYALQALIIRSELKVIPLFQYALIALYFGFKDISDRYLGSFIDILRADFPEQLKNTLFICIVALQIAAFTAAVAIPYFQSKRFVQSLESEKCR
jgi:hypothetical protein